MRPLRREPPFRLEFLAADHLYLVGLPGAVEIVGTLVVLTLIAGEALVLRLVLVVAHGALW